MLEHKNMKAKKIQIEKLIIFAKELGFDLVSFTKPAAPKESIKVFEKWLEEGNEASMEYMKKIDERKDLKKILKNAKSVIALAVNYYYDQTALKKEHGRIARYAYGRDYHKVIKKNLKELERYILKEWPSAETRSYVDTGPVLERAFAQKSGLGVIGKNACLITKEFGSWVFLAEIITNIDIPSEFISDYSKTEAFKLCGNCRKCMDACPTGAIIAPGVIDSRKCISYNTIENKGEVPPEIAEKIKQTKRIFGCDICQEVCPHNIALKKPIKINKIAGDQVSFKKIKSMKTDEDFLKAFATSPLMRAKRKGLLKTINYITDVDV
jgi:epoxyqueuosine reductase